MASPQLPNVPQRSYKPARYRDGVKIPRMSKEHRREFAEFCAKFRALVETWDESKCWRMLSALKQKVKKKENVWSVKDRAVFGIIMQRRDVLADRNTVGVKTTRLANKDLPDRLR